MKNWMFCSLFLLPGFLQAQKPKLVVPVGHLGRVITYALSPDGKHGVISVDFSRDGNATLTASAYRRRPPKFRSGVISSASSSDGKFKLTGGDDKTAKLWDSSGRLLQNFVGHTAQVNAVTFSPDGKLILTGSNDKTAKLWDLSGNRLQTFTGHKDYIYYVAFSTDGKKVLVEGEDGTAKIWDLSGRMLQEFKKYRIPTPKIPLLRGLRKLPREMRHPFFLADDNKNVLVRIDDGDTRILADSSWGVEYYKNYGMRLHRMQYDSLVPRVPSSHRLDLFSGNSYRSRRDEGDDNFYSGRHTSAITSVGFTSDKKFVILGCGCVEHTERALDVLGRKVQIIDSTSTEWKTALTSSRDGSEKLWVFSGRMSRSFKHAKLFAFSPDYKKLLTVSKNNTAILWDASGKMLFQRIPNNKETTSVVFSPDGKTILIGGWDLPPLQKAKVRVMSDRDNSQELWDLSGKVVKSFKGLGLENKAAFSPACPNDPNGGGTILTTNEEMTSSLWDTKSGKLLATLFMLDSTDWVVTTPSGLFDASDNAKKLIYYTASYEAEIIIITLDQLLARYWQPGLLGAIMGLTPYPVRNVGDFDNLKLFPSIEDSTRIESNQLYIKLRERNGGLGKLSLIINGRRQEENLNPNRKKDLNIDLTRYSRHLRTDTLNTIELEVYESKDELKSEPYKLYYQASVKKRGEGTEEEGVLANTCDVPRHLYLIVVGTSLYPQGVDSLPSAKEDAVEMARVLSETGKLLYDDRVHLKLLSTKSGTSPSKANIAAAFKAYQDSANICDVLVVFFAGHGSNWGKDGDKSNFYYLTQDITFGKLNDEGIRKAYAISDQELTAWMTAIPAVNQLLILDACNSGQAAINMGGIIARDIDPDKIVAFNIMSGNTGSYVISGSSASGASFESAVFGHGLLTYSLLEGINGTALEGSKVDVLPLLLKSYKRVGELAKSLGEEQTPIIAMPRGNASFFVGKNDGSVKIELAETKPMVIRSFLFDQNTFSDPLGLTIAVNKAFRGNEAKGKLAPWFFSDISEHPQGFSVRGGYTLNQDNTVTVKGQLLKGEDLVDEPFLVSGTKDAKLLAELILKAVKSGIRVK